MFPEYVFYNDEIVIVVADAKRGGVVLGDLTSPKPEVQKQYETMNALLIIMMLKINNNNNRYRYNIYYTFLKFSHLPNSIYVYDCDSIILFTS